VDAHVALVAGRVAFLVALCVVAGCAGRLAPFPADAREVAELDAVPFFPQKSHQCGPAALATVLAYEGETVVPDDLVSEVYLPAREGSLQPEIVGAIRRRGRVPWQLTGGLDELVAEIDAGRPVLVLQNLGVSWFPSWHYAVVVGYDSGSDHLVLRSGTRARSVERREIFLRTWNRSMAWGLVVLAPGELPVRADAERYFAALAALESVGQSGTAAAGYAAMVARWPERPEGHFGAGNLALAQGRWTEAEASYRRALDASSGAHVAARNNLAVALLERGCARAAFEEATRAFDGLTPEDPLRAAVEDTLRQAQSRERAVPDAEGCPSS
jgi:hypothetical protein